MIGGLILAAGAGRRFGGPKQLAVLHGRPLLAHALAAMRAVPAVERIVVVLGAHAERIQAEVDLAGVEVVVCPDWAEGQAASLRCGVRALLEAEAIVVTLGDQPLVTAPLIAGVLAPPAGVAAVRAVYDGEPGHPVLLTRSLFGRLLELQGDAGARSLLEEVPTARREVGHLGRADDVDTPAELEAVQL